MQKVDKRIDNHNATTYRTAHYSEQQVKHLNESANIQEKQIAKIFFKNPDKLFGPTQVHQFMFPDFPASRGDHPITSTRRAINNLTSAGILRKTDSTAQSLLGGVEHQWRWRSPDEQQAERQKTTHRDLVERQRKIDAGKAPRFQGDLAFEGGV